MRLRIYQLGRCILKLRLKLVPRILRRMSRSHLGFSSYSDGTYNIRILYFTFTLIQQVCVYSYSETLI